MNILYTNDDQRCGEIADILIDNNVPFVKSRDYGRLKKYGLYNLPYVEFDFDKSCGCGVILGYTEIKDKFLV